MRATHVSSALDFGIAKAVEPISAETATATMPAALTAIGVVVGTPAYMAPEQATGGATDTRTDIWVPLPGGTSILFTVNTRNARNVAVLDLQTLTWRTLLEGAASAKYLESGHLLYVAAGSLWATRFDLSRLELQGTPVEVVPRPAFGQFAQYDVSRDGALVYARGLYAFGIEVNVPTWVTRNGGCEAALPLPPDNYMHPRISPDRRRLALAQDSGDIYLWDLTQPHSQKSRMTFTDGQEFFPVWTPDSRRLVFGWREAWGSSNIYIQDIDKSTAVRLTTSSDMQLPTAVAPDGTVLFHSFPRDIHSVSMSGNRDITTLVDSPVEERNIALSRDGRWTAYEGETAGRPGELNVYVRPYPDVSRRVWQITTTGGTFPVWAPSSRELFYLKPDGTMAVVPIDTTGGNLAVGDSTDLFRGRLLAARRHRWAGSMTWPRTAAFSC